MDMTAVSAALSSIRAASDIVKGLVGVNTTVEVNNAVLDLQRTLLAAHGDMLNSAEEISALKDEIRKLKESQVRDEDFATEMKRYKLDVPWSGCAVYALDEAMSNGEPAHYLCTNCYQARKKSVLQSKYDAKGFVSFDCPSCRSSAPTGWRGAAMKFAKQPE